MAAGHSYTTPADITAALAFIPDFVRDPAEATHLSMITMAAHKHALAQLTPLAIPTAPPSDIALHSPRRPRQGTRSARDRRSGRGRTQPHLTIRGSDSKYAPRPTVATARSTPGPTSTFVSAQPCASFNSTAHCQRRDCAYAHALPSTAVAAARCRSPLDSIGIR